MSYYPGGSMYPIHGQPQINPQAAYQPGYGGYVPQVQDPVIYTTPAYNPQVSAPPNAPMAFGAPPVYNTGGHQPAAPSYPPPVPPPTSNSFQFSPTSPTSPPPPQQTISPGYAQAVPNSGSMPFSSNAPGIGIPPTPGGSSACVTQVELTIKCRNLIDKDVLSKSDPMVCCSMQCSGRWIEKGRTENIRNSLNPDFSHQIRLDYFFEETQKLKFEVFDIDNNTPQLDDDDFLGMMECTLGQIVSSAAFTRPLLYKDGIKIGTSIITVYAEEVDTNSREVLKLSFKAENLDNKEWFGKSDPFLEFRKAGPDGKQQMVHRTEFVKSNLNPTWRPFEIRQQSLGASNTETEIFVTCYDWESSGNHAYIGECKMTLGELLEGQAQMKVWPCININKQKKKGSKYKSSGRIILTSCKVTKAHSFLDYVFGGTQINFTVAIDFTASNGDPRQPNSLHYIHPQQPNEYTSAIWAVGGVVQDYDSDKMFPALGFGAKIPPHYQVSHEFALNFNMSNPFCSGVEGLVQAYQNCLMQVQLYGPTNFSPVIGHVARFAQQAHQQSTPENYFILLILTDGVVTDMPDTCRAIVRASHLPMSIIIVGVGRADFSNMNFLDGDGELLKAADGSRAMRDIVQFVPYYKFKNLDPAYLAKEVLAEVPQQLTEYYRLRNIPPKPSRHNLQAPPT